LIACSGTLSLWEGRSTLAESEPTDVAWRVPTLLRLQSFDEFAYQVKPFSKVHRQIAAEQQFAEKLHADTLPRGEPVNTRTKDLIDMVLLIRGETLDKSKTAAAVRATFMKRATLNMPNELDPPPAEWEPVFDALAKEQ
jgi:hypothetical protein